MKWKYNEQFDKDYLNCIYSIKNIINEKRYIGKAINLKNRLIGHRRKNSKSVISKAIQKYGLNNFKIDILEENINNDLMNEKEIFYVKYFNSFKEGYNCSLGGDGGNCFPEGYKHSKASIEKSIKTRKERNIKPSQETKEQISATLKEYYKNNKGHNSGKTFSEESRKKMSESRKKYFLENPLAKEQHLKNIHSPQSIKKTSLKKVGKKRSEEFKKMIGQVHKKLKWCNDGNKNYRLENIPAEYKPGMLNKHKEVQIGADISGTPLPI